MNIENIPEELKQRRQWVLHSESKLPLRPDGFAADPTNDRDMSTYVDAEWAYQLGGFAGLGFALRQSDPITFVDFDKCIVDGQIKTDIWKIVKELDSYTEISPSGTGIHVLLYADKPGSKCKNSSLGIEIYDQARYFTVTGNHVPGTPLTIAERQTELNSLYSQVFPQENKERGPEQLPAPKSPHMVDTDILSIARRAKNGEKFRALFEDGDVHKYHGGDDSAADLALCNILAFYTKDPEQIDRIFRYSALMRDKWERQDYRDWTIGNALAYITAQYSGNAENGRDSEFDTNDKGNAERLIHFYKDVMRYCSSLGGWLIWDNRRWKKDDTGESIRLAMTISKKIEQGEYLPIWNNLTDIEKEIIQTFQKKDIPPELLKVKVQLDSLRTQAEKAKSERGINAMLNLAAAYLSVNPEEMDADNWLINVNNGILDLRTGVLYPHDGERLITKLAPIDYDPSATCPLWEKAVHEIFEDENGNPRPNEIRFLQKALGYALTGSVKEHAFFIIHGRRGRNGKGLIFNKVAKVLGDYVEQINANVLLAKKIENSGEGPSPGIAKLKGARLVLASETDRGRRLDEALIKGLTGGDPITARFLHKNEMTFSPTFKIFLQTNYAPNVDGTDQGIWDRIRKLDFLRYFGESERDTDLPEKLDKEAAGIFRWMVEGCFFWQREGLPDTDGTRQSKTEYLEEVDSIPRYAQNNLWFHPSAMVNATELYRNYQQWCWQDEEYVHKKKEFIQRLEAHMSRNGHILRKNERDSTGTRRVHKGVGFSGQRNQMEGRDITVLEGSGQG